MKNLKTKLSVAAASLFAVANSASAAITMDNSGSVSGSLDLGTFYGVAGVVIVALGAMWAVKSGIRLIRA